MFVYRARYIFIPSDIENIQLSSEEKGYYMGRFGQSVVACAQLEMADTVGEGIQVN